MSDGRGSRLSLSARIAPRNREWADEFAPRGTYRRDDRPVRRRHFRHDSFVERKVTQTVASAARNVGERVEVYEYPGSAHLFTDPCLADYDARSASQVLARELEFIDRSDPPVDVAAVARKSSPIT